MPPSNAGANLMPLTDTDKVVNAFRTPPIAGADAIPPQPRQQPSPWVKQFDKLDPTRLYLVTAIACANVSRYPDLNKPLDQLETSFEQLQQRKLSISVQQVAVFIDTVSEGVREGTDHQPDLISPGLRSDRLAGIRLSVSTTAVTPMLFPQQLDYQTGSRQTGSRQTGSRQTGSRQPQPANPTSVMNVVDEQSLIELSSLEGKRYTAANLKNQIEAKLNVQSGKVSLTDAQQIQRLFDGRKTDVNSKTGKLYVTNVLGREPSILQFDVHVKLDLKDTYLPPLIKNICNGTVMWVVRSNYRISLPAKPSKPTSALTKISSPCGCCGSISFTFPVSSKVCPLTESINSGSLRGNLLLDNMTGADNQSFSAYVRIHAGLGALSFACFEPATPGK